MDEDTTQDTGTGEGDTEVDEEEIESERQERLDPDNRPDNAEVDNTQRDFDPEIGHFTDSDEAQDAEPTFADDDELSTGSEESENA